MSRPSFLLTVSSTVENDLALAAGMHGIFITDTAQHVQVLGIESLQWHKVLIFCDGLVHGNGILEAFRQDETNASFVGTDTNSSIRGESDAFLRNFLLLLLGASQDRVGKLLPDLIVLRIKR